MIVFETVLESMVEQMPEIAVNTTLSRKPQFYWGEQKDLPPFIKVMKEKHYPLIWLVNGKDNYPNGRDFEVNRKSEIVFLTRETRTAFLNTQRLENSYKAVLYPMVEDFLNGLELFNPTSLLGGLEIVKHPNYSENGKSTKKGEYVVTEIWDALKVYCEIEIDNNCKNIIQWQ